MWPRLEFEAHEWVPRLTFAGREAAFDRARPYLAAVPLEIAERSLSIGASTAALMAEATAEIARFDGESGGDLGPFDALLLRSESAASSQIEHLTASARAVLMAESGDTSRMDATIIAANTGAMRAALELADSLDEAAIIEMHRALLGSSQPTMVGAFRSEQVWIGGRSTSPHTASFVPPHQDRVLSAMADLVRFMQRTDIAPFVLAMVAHAQFETIHPFPDGNGRTGRALIHAVLRHTSVTRTLTVPVSAGLLADTASYFAALDAYRAGDVDPIIVRASDAAFAAIHNGRQLREDLRHVNERWQALIKDVRSDSVVRRIVAGLPQMPVVDGVTVAALHHVSLPTAQDAIKRLAELGVLVRANGGLRFRKWIASDVTDALDRFAERSQRRASS